MERALRAAGARISSQRRGILEYLAVCTSHPSARQVFKEVREKHPGLSLATVYNTLGMLTRMRLIKVMQFDGTDNRYDPNVAPHINLICTSCGKIADLEQEGGLVFPEEIEGRVEFEVLDCRLEYYGLCAECKAGAQEKLPANDSAPQK
jgi:Fur family peroxide stress response transcriptional regulator